MGIQSFSTKNKPTHTVKLQSKENSHTLMTQKLKPLLRSKKSKKKLSQSHQLEPSTEKERTLSKPIHMDKPLLKENSLILTTQKSRLLSRSKRSKRKPSLFHQ